MEKFRNHVGIKSWFSTIKSACNSFVSDERIVWVSIEGLPINTLTYNTFSKVSSKWGDLVVWVESEENSLSWKHLCLMTKIDEIINESFKIVLKGKVHWIRAKELHVWIPNFLSQKDTYTSDDELDVLDEEHKFGDNEFENPKDDSDVEKVSESSCMHGMISSMKMLQILILRSHLTLMILLIFTICFKRRKASSQRTTSIPITGGSILEVIDDLVKGLGHKDKKGWIKELCMNHKINFIALQETKMESIDLFSIKALWAEVFQFESLKLLQRQLFRSLEDWEVSSLQCMQRS
ncbi:hypothetical protein Tco_0772444 [Tanacetum coccineum]|uniref:RNA-directed DNA polymerase, eukaryota n=1 Tax=Tanacetum coccineum TaxID=301880 RepID=A0ABQ4ZLR1_9ASTR